MWTSGYGRDSSAAHVSQSSRPRVTVAELVKTSRATPAWRAADTTARVPFTFTWNNLFHKW